VVEGWLWLFFDGDVEVGFFLLGEGVIKMWANVGEIDIILFENVGDLWEIY
jgi:hypothetical protein